MDLHMIEKVPMWCPKEHQEMWKSPHVGSLLKKLVSEDTIVPQDSQRGGHENKQLGVMPNGKEKC